MASLSDILTASQNIVVALNNIGSQLTALYNTAHPVQMYEGQLPTSVGVLYTSSTATASEIRCINAANTTGAALSYYLFIVPAGGTPSAANALMYNVSVYGASTLLWDGAAVVPPGGTIQAYSSSAGITLTLDGRTGL